jgi:hypothetical protein
LGQYMFYSILLYKFITKQENAYQNDLMARYARKKRGKWFTFFSERSEPLSCFINFDLNLYSNIVLFFRKE